jgi:acyl-CoA thioester hydrolase
MARIKIQLPENFSFSLSIPIRITDLNYGGHVGNDAILSLAHEARMQYLSKFGYSELEFAGIGLIMADAGIEFKNELFYGEMVTVWVTCGSFSKIGFDLYYKLEKQSDGLTKPVAFVKTGMVGYNYTSKKIAAIPEDAREKMQSAK